VTGRLVALDLPGGTAFVQAITTIWERGDAVLPLDQRLPMAARQHLLSVLAPTHLWGADGRELAVAGGQEVEPGDALVVATSGSTGMPRGVVLTHDAVAASAQASNHALDVDRHDHWLACLPLSHVGGLSVVTRALHAGTRLTVLPHASPEAIEATTLGDHPVTLVSLVPTLLQRVDVGRFRRVLLGGSRPPATRPPHVIATYGLTETGSGVVYDGRALPGVELRLGKGDLIEVRCPMLLRCYRDGTIPIDADGWFSTGDVGALEPDGRLRVEGRRGDLIITGGENVWPDPVEATLLTHPQVAEVAVAGRPDAEWGQVVTAWVVPTDPGNPPTLDTLRGHVRATLPAYCAPRRVELVPSLPRTALGKIRRSALGADH
jgi:o-succinylbenzoate---CoA ligase